jgi:hypothetical protein
MINAFQLYFTPNLIKFLINKGIQHRVYRMLSNNSTSVLCFQYKLTRNCNDRYYIIFKIRTDFVPS